MRVHDESKNLWRELRVLDAVGVIFALLHVLGSQASLKAAGQGADSTALTFESFLEHPPKIASAIYAEDMAGTSGFSPEITNTIGHTIIGQEQPSARQVTCELKCDGDNYLLSVIKPGIAGSGGQFDGVRWGVLLAEQGQSFLVLADPKSNPRYIPVLSKEVASRYRARRFLNLGIYEMVPGSVVWASGEHKFVANYDTPSAPHAPVKAGPNSAALSTNWVSSGQMTVELRYSNDVPVEAAGMLDTGIRFTIRYTYSSDFCAGRLPIEFCRFFDESLGENGRAYTIRVHQLEIAPTSMPIAEFDPQQALKGKFLAVSIWTNGVRYWQSSAGVLKKALTTSEIAQGLSLRPRVRWKLGLRIAVLCVLLAPGLYLCYRWIQSTQRRNGSVAEFVGKG